MTDQPQIQPPSEGDVLAAAATLEALSRFIRCKPDYVPDVRECQVDRWSAVELRSWVAKQSSLSRQNSDGRRALTHFTAATAQGMADRCCRRATSRSRRT
jgi:hypothetical protein